MRAIYTFVFYLFLPFILLRLLWRSIAAPAYAKRWAERFGFFPALVTSKQVVWLHTVSVGEFLGALPLIRRLLADEKIHLVITTTTPTGSERVRALLGDAVFHVYAPYDLPDAIGRFLRRVQPSMYLIMETELWPNTVAACARRKIPAVLINARLSEKSARGYARFSKLTSSMLNNLHLVLIQNSIDAARFVHLGLAESKVRITGNIKFDLTLNDELRLRAAELKQQILVAGERLIWIAASTHQGEDEIILDTFAQVRQKLGENAKQFVLILVPRHPERFERVGQLCEARGFKTLRRSTSQITEDMDILLGDTMGELMVMFGASDIAFVGGSLVPNGGHNFIEPAAWGLPLLSGQHLFNFAEVSALLTAADALDVAQTTDDLVNHVHHLVQSSDLRARKGENALRVAVENRGALEKTLHVIKSLS